MNREVSAIIRCVRCVVAVHLLGMHVATRRSVKPPNSVPDAGPSHEVVSMRFHPRKILQPKHTVLAAFVPEPATLNFLVAAAVVRLAVLFVVFVCVAFHGGLSRAALRGTRPLAANVHAL